jgi:hypothetical protein
LLAHATDDRISISHFGEVLNGVASLEIKFEVDPGATKKRKEEGKG